MEELGVGLGHHLVVGSGNDPDRCLDAWQQLGEFWKVFTVALGRTGWCRRSDRLRSKTCTLRESRLTGGVARDGAQGDLDDLAPADLAVWLQIGCFDPLLENAGDI